MIYVLLLSKIDLFFKNNVLIFFHFHFLFLFRKNEVGNHDNEVDQDDSEDDAPLDLKVSAVRHLVTFATFSDVCDV